MGGTATEAAILKESTLKRINMIAELVEMDSIIRLGRLKWSNIQFFYPAPKITAITESNRNRARKTYRKVNLDGQQFSIVKNDKGQNALKVSELLGTSALELNKAMLRFIEGDFDIVIEADAYSSMSKPIKQSKITEMFNLMSNNPSLIGVLDPKKAVRRYLEINDEDPDQWLKGTGQSDEDLQLIASQENMVMSAGIPLGPTEGATQAHTLVHLQHTKTPEFQQLPPEIQALFEAHIMGEDASNPATGGGAGQPTAPGGEMLNATGPPSIQTANPPGRQMQVADMQATDQGPRE
jgi:hypothetical protein